MAIPLSNPFSLGGVLALIRQAADDFFVEKPSPFSSDYSPEQLEKLWLPSLTGATEQLIETRFGTVNVTIGGKPDGTALVLWPSLMMKASMWSGQYEHFRHNYRVLLIDSPGINKSEGLRKLLDMRDCKDILVTILDTLGIEKCIFGGNSWGAMLAPVLPAWIPHRLLGTFVANGTAELPTLAETVLMTIRAELLMMCEKVPQWWVSIAREAFASDSAETSNPEFLAYNGCISREDPKSIAWAIKGILLGRKDNYALLRRMPKEVPVLVIAAGEDRQFHVPMCRKMADAIPTCKFVVIPGVGHLASRERPDLVNAQIDQWLAEIGIGNKAA